MAVRDGRGREGEDTYFYLSTHKIVWKGKKNLKRGEIPRFK